MPVTVKFDPTVNSLQAQVISDATPFNDGVMSKAQAAKLANLSPGGFSPGGYRQVASVAARDAIPSTERLQGRWVITNDTGLIWQLNADLTTWTVICRNSIRILSHKPSCTLVFKRQ